MKLTQRMRRDICNEIVQQKVTIPKKENKILSEEQTVLYINEQLKPYEKFIKSAPAGFLYKANTFYMCFGETYEERIYVGLSKYIEIPYSWKNSSSCYISIKETKWKKVFSDIYKQDKYLESYEEKLKRELKSVLSACTTTAKLIKIFPEVMQYITADKLEFFPPVVQTDKLIALLQES